MSGPLLYIVILQYNGLPVGVQRAVRGTLVSVRFTIGLKHLLMSFDVQIYFF